MDLVKDYLRTNGVCETQACIRASSMLALSMNRTLDPCDDFYKYACGAWHMEHPRPSESSSYDWFNDRQTRILRQVRDYLRLEPDTKQKLPLPLKQSRWMYKACMDTEKLEDLSYAPIVNYLHSIQMPAVPTYFLDKVDVTNMFSNLTNYVMNNEGAYITNFDWIITCAAHKRLSTADLLIGFAVYPHPMNGSRTIMLVGSPENTNPLPSYKELSKRLEKVRRAMSTKERSPNQKRYLTFIRDVTLNYITEVTQLEGTPPVDLMQRLDDAAEAIYNLEEKLYEINEMAKNISLNSTADLMSSMKEITVEELQTETNLCLDGEVDSDKQPHDLWSRYIQKLFEGIQSGVNVTGDKILIDDSEIFYLCSINRLMHTHPARELELYLWWQIMEILSVHTTKTMRQLYDRYAGQVLGKTVCQIR
ncbi:membrane metallo-endopeptidase-like 1 [Ctenocephalides felis]|uniref:membrane metallo-endopeptidase-like 1 n=1 Tax=Ctenocephalides felis TaxID=7515 RepID=UPI000E6E48A8|nr:membrane metallo-endopeptidase-like 1 [Ctenocephalides felis]